MNAKSTRFVSGHWDVHGGDILKHVPAAKCFSQNHSSVAEEASSPIAGGGFGLAYVSYCSGDIL